MNDWFVAVINNILSVVNSGSAAALFALVGLTALMDLGLPVPFLTETMLFAASYQAGPFSRQVMLLVAALLAGRHLGTGFIYIMTKTLGNRLVGWFERRFRGIHRKLTGVAATLNRWAFLGLMTARLTPGMSQVSTMAAAVVKVRYRHVLIGTTLASLLYDGLLITLGFIGAKGLAHTGANFSIWMVGGMLLILAPVWGVFLLRARKKKEALK